MSRTILNTGMPGLKLTKRKPITSSASPVKLKHMTK